MESAEQQIEHWIKKLKASPNFQPGTNSAQKIPPTTFNIPTIEWVNRNLSSTQQREWVKRQPSPAQRMEQMNRRMLDHAKQYDTRKKNDRKRSLVEKGQARHKERMDRRTNLVENRQSLDQKERNALHVLTFDLRK